MTTNGPLSDLERQQLKMRLNAEFARDFAYKGGMVDGTGFHPLNEAIDVNSIYPAELRAELEGGS